MMDALTALHTRVSVYRVRAPAPDQATMEKIIKAGLRTADHGMLKPWRFLTVQGDSLNRLGELFAQATLADAPDTTTAELDKVRTKTASRAPMILIGIVSPKDIPKIPVAEQHLSTGGALQNMLTAAHALNVGAIWRTGPLANHPVVHRGLGLAGHESIIGFIYLGTIDGPTRELRDEPVSNYSQEW